MKEESSGSSSGGANHSSPAEKFNKLIVHSSRAAVIVKYIKVHCGGFMLFFLFPFKPTQRTTEKAPVTASSREE